MDDLVTQLLVATPLLQSDPYFAKAIVYIFEHQQQGAIGLILNQPGALSLADVLERAEMAHILNSMALAHDFGLKKVLSGGPLAPQYGVVVQTQADTNALCIESLTEARLEKVCQQNQSMAFELCFGISAWSQGQLEQEIEQGAWQTLPYDTQFMQTPYRKRYALACQLLGFQPGQMSLKAGVV